MRVSQKERRAAEAFAVALEAGGVAAASADPLVRLAGRLTAVPLRPMNPMPGLAAAHLAAGLPAALAPSVAAPTVAGPTVAAPGLVSAPVISALPAWAAGPAVQAVTGLLAVAVAVTGTGLATSRSVPGDPLYGLKRQVERLQSHYAGDQVDQGVVSLDHVQTRVDELLGLLGRTDGAGLDIDQVRATLRALDDELRHGTDLLLAAARSGAANAAQDLIEFTDAQVARLTALLPQLPLLLRVDVAHTLQLLEAAKQAAVTVPVSPPGVGTPPVTPASRSANPAVPTPSASVPAPSPSPLPAVSPAPSVSPAPTLPVPLPTHLLG